MNKMQLPPGLRDDCWVEFNDDLECWMRFEFEEKKDKYGIPVKDADGNPIIEIETIVFYNPESDTATAVMFPHHIFGKPYMAAKQEIIEAAMMERDQQSLKFSDVDEQTGIRKRGEL